MGIIKNFDEIEVTGFCGYDPKTFARYQTEAAFVKHTWPLWLFYRGTRESVNGLSYPPIYFNELGPIWYIYRQIIPVKLIVRVEFGAARFREV